MNQKTVEDRLSEYICDWMKIEGCKPENSDEFTDDFIEFLNKVDDPNDLGFDGDGSYFGKQISLCIDSRYFGSRFLNFEIAYSLSQIVVYRGDNNGYWVPTFISIDKDNVRFKLLYNAIRNMVLRLMSLESNLD